MAYCTRCGVGLEGGINYCRRCGAPTLQSAELSPQRVPSDWSHDQDPGSQPNTGKWVAIAFGGILVVGVLVSLVGAAIVRVAD